MRARTVPIAGVKRTTGQLFNRDFSLYLLVDTLSYGNIALAGLPPSKLALIRTCRSRGRAPPYLAMRAHALLALCAGVSATDPFVVTFDVTLATGKKDSFDLEVQPEWAPLGAARFKELVDEEFFTSVRFFRVLPGFMAQFGIHGKPEISSTWRDRKLSGIDTA